MIWYFYTHLLALPVKAELRPREGGFLLKNHENWCKKVSTSGICASWTQIGMAKVDLHTYSAIAGNPL